MTQIDHPRTRRTTANASASRRPGPPAGRRPAVRLIADAVVAAYVQDIARPPTEAVAAAHVKS
jgi:hypothetical protein